MIVRSSLSYHAHQELKEQLEEERHRLRRGLKRPKEKGEDAASKNSAHVPSTHLSEVLAQARSCTEENSLDLLRECIDLCIGVKKHRWDVEKGEGSNCRGTSTEGCTIKLFPGGKESC
jgi:hypothetical protein